MVKITYTPKGADNRAFLNGFEIDGPDMGRQIGFPTPSHLDQYFEATDGSVKATWHAPEAVESPRYNVYLGTSPSDLMSVSLGEATAEVTFPGKHLPHMDTYSGIVHS